MQTERLFLGPKTSADQQKHMFIKMKVQKDPHLSLRPNTYQSLITVIHHSKHKFVVACDGRFPLHRITL